VFKVMPSCQSRYKARRQIHTSLGRWTDGSVMRMGAAGESDHANRCTSGTRIPHMEGLDPLVDTVYAKSGHRDPDNSFALLETLPFFLIAPRLIPISGGI